MPRVETGHWNHRRKPMEEESSSGRVEIRVLSSNKLVKGYEALPRNSLSN